MDFLWPLAFWLLPLIPLLVAAYIWMLRRRKRTVVRFSSLSLIHAAQPKFSAWKRHIPFAAFCTALALLVLALSRPVTVTAIPAGQTTMILAMDVSRSMCSTDIPPNRLIAAERAALSFIQSQPSSMQIGVVAFAGFAEVILEPTNDQDELQRAIESLTTGRRTAIGSGILKSIDLIAEVDSAVAPSITEWSSAPAPSPVPQGAYVPEIIVLLTDGASNAGPEPILAAQQAADRGIRVYTIGYGTAEGGDMAMCGERFIGGGAFDNSGGMSGGGFGGGGFGGGGFRRGIDEETLQAVADLTGGTYSSAESASELQEVFRSLPTSLITKSEITEVSAIVTLLAAIFAIVAFVFSMRWQAML